MLFKEWIDNCTLILYKKITAYTFFNISCIWNVLNLYAFFHCLLCPFVEKKMLKIAPSCTMFTKCVNPVLIKVLLRTTHTIALRWPFLCGHSSTITYNQRIMSTCQIIMSTRHIFLSTSILFTCWKIQHKNVCAFSVVIIFFSQVDIGIWHVNIIIFKSTSLSSKSL